MPLITALTDDPNQQAALRLIISRQTIARPYVLPPEVPLERLNALRAAFDATMRDPEFLGEAKQLGLEVNPMTGVDAAALVKQIYATPPGTVKSAITYMTGAR